MTVLGALLLGSLQVASTPPPPAVVQEITVIGRKLKRWKGATAKRNGTFVCKTEKSSGDKEVDAIRCDASRFCMAQIDGEAQAILASTMAAKERKARLNALAQKMMPTCLERYEDAAVLALAERRAG